jgi:hypothetical protein
MASNDKELLEFALNQLGGKEYVQQQFIKQRLLSSISGGAKIGDIIDQAEKEGWLPTLRNIQFSDLLGMTKQKKEKSAGGRLSKDQKAAAVSAIHDYLKEHRWASKNDLASAIGIDAGKLGSILAGMRNEDQVKTAGSKRNTVYALFGERTKAPVD